MPSVTRMKKCGSSAPKRGCSEWNGFPGAVGSTVLSIKMLCFCEDYGRTESHVRNAAIRHLRLSGSHCGQRLFPNGSRCWRLSCLVAKTHGIGRHARQCASHAHGCFSRRLRAWAAEEGIPVRDCRMGEARHEIGEQFLQITTVQEGLFLILVSRAPAPVCDVHPNRRITRKKPASM